MRARAVRQVRGSSAFTGKSGPYARTFPVQARPKGPGPAHRPNNTEPERTGNIAGRGGSFGDVPVFPDQRKFNQDQGGGPLPARLRQRMESAFGSDFSDVRVHQGPSANSLGALAFTQGRDIHFAPGQYNPATAEGQRIIAHELMHVVQQRQGRVAIPSGGGVPVNADASLESEADTLGARAMRGEYLPESSTGSPARQRSNSDARAPIQGLLRTLFRGRGGGGWRPPRRPTWDKGGQGHYSSWAGRSRKPMPYWEMQKLLHERGLTKQQRQELTESMGPDVFSMKGKMGDEVTVTGVRPGSASGVFATLGSSGHTPEERRESLALPSSNTAEAEETRHLGFDQTVLEGEVAPQGLPYMQPSEVFTQPREGGGRQIVTAGGRYTGAVVDAEQLTRNQIQEAEETRDR